MSDDRATRLLNEELDGELDAAGRSELDALLATNPGLAAQREALRALDRTLREVADTESPPQGFARRIAGGIELPAQPTLLDRLASAWRRSFWVPASAFAAGLVVAAVLYPALDRSLDGADATHMTGTLTSEPTGAGLMPYARLELALDELKGEVTLADPGAGKSLLEFELASHGPVNVSIDLDGSGLEYAELPATDAVRVLEREGTRLLLRSERPGYFAVALQGAGRTDGTVKVEFSLDGRAVSAGVLPVR